MGYIGWPADDKDGGYTMTRFREGYAQGIAERENTPHDNAVATCVLREAYCGLA